jgi:hypothetical protein
MNGIHEVTGSIPVRSISPSISLTRAYAENVSFGSASHATDATP